MRAKHWTPAKKRFDPGKKALGISAGTDELAATESARDDGAAPPRMPGAGFLRVRLPEVGSAGPAKSESRKAKAGTDGRRDRHHSYRDVHRLARICTEQSRAQRGFATPR